MTQTPETSMTITQRQLGVAGCSRKKLYAKLQYQLSLGMIHDPNSSWNFHDLHQSAQGPPRDLGWHFGHRGRTRSSALPRPPAPHLACCNAPPGATGRTKPRACVVGTDLKDRSMMGPKLRDRSLTAGKHVEHHVMRRLRLLRRRGASGGCPWRCGRHWMTRGSRWIWMGSGDWTFGSSWKSAEELGFMIIPWQKM